MQFEGGSNYYPESFRMQYISYDTTDHGYLMDIYKHPSKYLLLHTTLRQRPCSDSQSKLYDAFNLPPMPITLRDYGIKGTT